MILGFFY